jgi:hypothetical protein
MIKCCIFLAGASYLDVMVHAGISRAVFYSSVYKGLDAINRYSELQLKMPMSLTNMQDQLHRLFRYQ